MKREERTMATVFYDRDADLNLIRSRKVGVIGYGSQGHAHALNLRDCGVEVCVGLREGSASWSKAEADGLKVCPVEEAAGWADVVMMLVPDTSAPAIYESQVAPSLSVGQPLMFAHGFNIRFETIRPPAGIDVSMVAPKGPGHRVRETYVEGGGVPGDERRAGVREVRRGARLHDLAQPEAHRPRADLRSQVFLERAGHVPGSLESLGGELVALAVLLRVVLGGELRVGHRRIQFP